MIFSFSKLFLTFFSQFKMNESVVGFKMLTYFRMLLLMLVVIILLNETNCEQVKYKCSQKELDKLDFSFARVMGTSKYQRITPENHQQLNAFCK